MKTRLSTDILPALALLSAFAACILALLVSGAGVYKRIAARADEQYAGRTCIEYINTKIKHYDRAGGIEIGELDGVNALILHEDDQYLTYIYCADGWMSELYTSKDSGLLPSDGEKILEVGDVQFEQCRRGVRIILIDTSGARTEHEVALLAQAG